MRAGEAIKIEYEYPVNKPDQVRVTKLRPAGKWLHLVTWDLWSDLRWQAYWAPLFWVICCLSFLPC